MNYHLYLCSISWKAVDIIDKHGHIPSYATIAEKPSHVIQNAQQRIFSMEVTYVSIE